MAKLGVAYGLCPIIDYSSLLGVTSDSVPGCVIVTIGKNIVIRYKFQDQKQVNSWSTKDKLTSPVVYDKASDQYIAVFNHDQLRLWKKDDHLDQVKKYKFQQPLHSVIPDMQGNSRILLYQNGCVAMLDEAIESRKENACNPAIKSTHIIKDYTLLLHSGMELVAFVSCNGKKETFLNIVPVTSSGMFRQYCISHSEDENVHLIGQTIMNDDETCSLLTLWSNGKLFSYNFLQNSEDFPGHFILTIKSVSTQIPVALAPISSNHVALFGADPSEEGATLILLNLQYQLIQSRLHFKLYATPPRLWNVSSHLLVAVGSNLIAVPYRLESEQLSTLIGTHCSSPAMTSTCWFSEDSTPQTLCCNAPQKINKVIEDLIHKGYAQGKILQNIIPDLLRKKDLNNILWCLKNFYDIPESTLVSMLKFCLSQPNSTFCASEDKTLHTTTNGNQDSESEENTDPVSRCLEPTGRCELMDAILNTPFNDVALMPHLRGMSFSDTIVLLSYLSYLMANKSEVPLSRLIEWICLLLDTHYQEYLLCHGQDVLNLLKKLDSILQLQMAEIEEMKKLAPVLYKILSGKVPEDNSLPDDRKYCVETLKLY